MSNHPFDDAAQQTLLGGAADGFDNRPLAERLRPTALHEVIGQTHLLGPEGPLTRCVQARSVHSMILWGPPGVGKTTIARLIASEVDADLLQMSAVGAGVKDVRQAVQQAASNARLGRKTVLFLDEVHRFNKAQQDAFLPHVENGTVTFIGATTENPSFEVNAALLSRARVYVLQPLTIEELQRVAVRAASHLERPLQPQAVALFCQHADGDARRLISVLEIAAQMSQGEIDVAAAELALGDSVRRFDKGGDVFYEQISALHKALRGSAPDAALYWFCRMLDGGADPRYVGRRLVRFASEDVGNADPRALELTLAACATYERLGTPEGELALAQAVLYLASVPKSNAVYKAFNEAMAFVRASPSHPVPLHIRNAPTSLMKDLGYGDEYRYAHNESTSEGGYAAGEDYFPSEMPPQQFYAPLDAGLENKIKQRLERLRALDREAARQRREDHS
ncbi:MAG: replication-associated recombination protein A [Pseudomonadota bacterium]